MKRLLIFYLAVLLALSICACAASEYDTTYSVTKNGTDYVVDQENGTISDGTYTYQYTFSGNSSGYDIKITYPNGSTYSWHMANSNGWGFGGGGGSEDYDPDRYAPGDVLCDILEEGAPQAGRGINPGQILLGIILVGIGLFNVLSPQTAWYLTDGWKFKDAEPSEAAIGLARLGGGFAIFVGIVALLAGILS